VISEGHDPAPAPRLGPSRPPTAEEPTAVPASDHRGGLTPLNLLVVLIVAYLLIQIQFVLVLVLLSLVFATVISRPVDALDRRGVPRPLAILLIYVGLIAALTALFLVISPVIREQAVTFRLQAPESLGRLRAAWQGSGNALLAGPGQQLLSRGIDFIRNPDPQGVSVPQGAAIGLLTGVGGTVIGIVTVLIISFYYLWRRHSSGA